MSIGCSADRILGLSVSMHWAHSLPRLALGFLQCVPELSRKSAELANGGSAINSVPQHTLLQTRDTIVCQCQDHCGFQAARVAKSGSGCMRSKKDGRAQSRVTRTKEQDHSLTSPLCPGFSSTVASCRWLIVTSVHTLVFDNMLCKLRPSRAASVATSPTRWWI